MIKSDAQPPHTKKNYLFLNPDPITFKPFSSNENNELQVYFGAQNQQIISIFNESDGKNSCVSLKGPDPANQLTFQLVNNGRIASIKFNKDQSILSIQRAKNMINFVNFRAPAIPDTVEYSQMCRDKNSRIHHFEWISATEILYVTSSGLELYRLTPQKRSAQLLKNYNQPINWHHWNSRFQIVLSYSAKSPNQLSLFAIANSTITKLHKLELDPPNSSHSSAALVSTAGSHGLSSYHANSTASSIGSTSGGTFGFGGGAPSSVSQNDCFLLEVYAQLFVALLRPRDLCSSQILLYRVRKESAPRKQHILEVDVKDFTLNLVDNLIVLHHFHSKTSRIYDIAIGHFQQQQPPSGVTHHRPIVAPLSLDAAQLELDNAEVAASSHPIVRSELSAQLDHTQRSSTKRVLNVPLYSNSWRVFLPNIVIDGELGCMWRLSLRLEPFTRLLSRSRPLKLFMFLMNRANSRSLVIDLLRNFVAPPPPLPPPASSSTKNLSRLQQFSALFRLFVHAQHFIQAPGLHRDDKVVCFPSSASSSCFASSSPALSVMTSHNSRSASSTAFSSSAALLVQRRDSPQPAHNSRSLSRTSAASSPSSSTLPPAHTHSYTQVGVGIGTAGEEGGGAATQQASPSVLSLTDSDAGDLIVAAETKVTPFPGELEHESRALSAQRHQEQPNPQTQREEEETARVLFMTQLCYDILLIWLFIKEVFETEAEEEEAEKEVIMVSHRHWTYSMSQQEVYTNVFLPMQEHLALELSSPCVASVASSSSWLVWLVLEYMRELQQREISVEFYIQEFLVNTLVRARMFFQLHQFIQYRLLADSKAIAILLLAHESVYPPAVQLALDMLKRISNGENEILEVLLSKKKVILALNFARERKLAGCGAARKFLDAAWASGDLHVFYTVFRYFENLFQKTRNSFQFLPSDHCQEHVEHFSVVFGPTHLQSHVSAI